MRSMSWQRHRASSRNKGSASSRISLHSTLNFAVDGFGHISMRHPVDANLFMMPRNLAPALVTQAFLPLLERSTQKTVVHISSSMGSIGGDLSKARVASYSMSKAALNMLVSRAFLGSSSRHEY